MREYRERRGLEDAVIAEVSHRGFAGATVAGVCRRAAVEPAAFDREYAGIEDCYCQVLGELRDRMLADMRYAFAAEAGWRESMRAASWAMADFFAADRRRPKFMGVESLNAGERSRAIVEGLVEAIVELVDQGRYELDDPDRLTRATAEATVGGVFNAVRVAMSRDQHRADELTPKLMFTVIQPYLGLEAALAELRLGRFEPLRAEDRTRVLSA